MSEQGYPLRKVKPRRKLPKICLGFPRGYICANKAGCPHTPYWCKGCNVKRMAHISAQLDTIAESYGLRPSAHEVGEGRGMAMSNEASVEKPRYFKFLEKGPPEHATPIYGVSCDEGWRQSIVATGMYQFVADWLVEQLQGKPFAKLPSERQS